ncbi:MAG: hypothetical protein ACJ8G7_02505, partial [Rhizobacter sp.]
APAAAAAPHRTFRYAEGAAPKIERAQLIERACTRAVVRTLRGWLLSIPQSRPADDSAEEACKSAERYPS